jgi:hypothetical protein
MISNTFLPINDINSNCFRRDSPLFTDVYNKVHVPFTDVNGYEIPITDIKFPYTRYFRGVYDSDTPCVYDRQAGLVFNYIEPKPQVVKVDKPNWCFETACSTRTPCRPEYLIKYSDKQEMEPLLNRYTINISP